MALHISGSVPHAPPVIGIGSAQDSMPGEASLVDEAASSVLSSSGTDNPTKTPSLKDRVRHIFCVIGRTLRIVWMAISALVCYIASRFAAGCVDLARTLFLCKKRRSCNGMVMTDHSVKKSRERYELNKGVMTDIAARHDSPQARRQAEFLSANFMGKVAPTQMHLLNKAIPGVESQFQMGSQCQYHYHRYGFVDNPEIGQKVNKRTFALAKESPFIPTDTIAFTQLYPLAFYVTDELTFPVDTLAEHFTQHDKSPLSSKLEKPLMFDLTDRMGYLMGKATEAEAKEEFKRIKAEVDRELYQAARELAERYPKYSRRRIRKWLKNSSVFICRVQDEDTRLCGIKALPIYKKMSKGRYVKAYPSLTEFISNTGLFIGAVNLRRHLWAEPLKTGETRLQPDSKGEYSPLPKYYNTPAEFLRSSGLSTRGLLTSRLGFDDEAKPHFQALGKGTVALLQGLMEVITEDQWADLCDDEFRNEVVQSSLFSIIAELSTARMHMRDNNFDAFSQSIEITHAYLANLLEMIHPFDERDYGENYRRMIGAIPGIDQAYIKPGLCKTGMNAFTAITSAIAQTKERPVRAYGKGFYFEQAGVIGYDNSLESILDDDSVEQVDLYACQFFPNVEIGSDFTHYEKGKVADEIHLILEKKPKTEHLTVAVDCTIDYVHSESMRELLTEFKDEIEDGRLNFVFFRSGQKLDQFGMDTYYGAPFVQVNNGGDYWMPFNNIHEEEAFRTDPLSVQWFSLAFTSASLYLDKYRELIFENARKITDAVPERLKPADDLSSQTVRVNTFSDDMLPSFIDIKISGPMHGVRAKWLLARFYEKFQREGHAINTRASFGFIQPNFVIIQINEVPDSTTIRLNPGINPEENQLIVDLISELNG